MERLPVELRLMTLEQVLIQSEDIKPVRSLIYASPAFYRILHIVRDDLFAQVVDPVVGSALVLDALAASRSKPDNPDDPLLIDSKNTKEFLASLNSTESRNGEERTTPVATEAFKPYCQSWAEAGTVQQQWKEMKQYYEVYILHDKKPCPSIPADFTRRRRRRVLRWMYCGQTIGNLFGDTWKMN